MTSADVGAVFDGFGEHSPLILENTSPRVAQALLGRIKDGSFDAWAHTAAQVGYCTRPIRLSGHTIRIDAATGEVLSEFRSSAQPLGALYQRCGNRRASVCPSCSRLYARDTFEVIRCGVTGGKNIPDRVADNPLLFVTLTAPSFGPVHGHRNGRPCRPRRPEGRTLCPHGRPTWCTLRHEAGDSGLGTPLCVDCYHYDAHLMWQWWAPELWRRFTIALGRALADQLGCSASQLKEIASIQYAKVAEVQHRGAVHFHALVRLDGPAAQGIGSPAPDAVTAPELAQLVTRAATHASCIAPAPTRAQESMLLRFGPQTDVKIVRAGNRPDDPAAALQPAQVAAYLAKYATKDAGDAWNADRNQHFATLRTLCIAWAGAARARENRRRDGHHVAMPVAKDGRDPYAKIGKWSHMLGFRGHFATKSRRYSVTLGTLRRARARFQALVADRERSGSSAVIDVLDLLADEQDDATTLVLKAWKCESTGWDTPADKVLADAAAARAREYDQWKASRNTHPHRTQES